MRVLLCYFFLGGFGLAAPLIPLPRVIELREGGLRVDVQTMVIAPEELAVPAQVITEALQKTSGALHFIRTPRELGRIKVPRAVRLKLEEVSGGEGAYELEVTAQGATIRAGDRAGLMSGVQTFVQFLPVAAEPFPRVIIPSQVIRDWPELKRRIFHLDVSQHLFPMAELKGVVDWLSFHKLNEFHLKLNGDAGWRMESLRFPKLHEVGSVRASTPPLEDPEGSDSTEYRGYYPQESLRELVNYAMERGVEVVPCFTFSTGASAVIAAYPELGSRPAEVASSWEERSVGVKMSSDAVQFFREFFTELSTVFSSTYVRLDGEGGGVHAVLGKLLEKSGRKLIVGKRVPSTNFSVYGRPAEGELLASAKLRAEDGFSSLRQVYELRSRGQLAASLRTRYVPEISKLEYLVFPRIAAFAEAAWLPFEKREYGDFRVRVDEMVLRYRAMGVQSALPYDPPSGEVLGGAKVMTSLKGRENHGIEMIFDGREDTFFWSEGPVEKGDYVVLEFPWPVAGGLTVSTGGWGEARDRLDGVLLDGTLEFSADGKGWDGVVEFFDGSATVTMPDGTRFIRVKASVSQEKPFILHEVALEESLITPVFSEERQVRLSPSGKELTLAFHADFEKYPELRDEVTILRRTFFSEWLPLALKLGLEHSLKTPRVFRLEEGDPGELSADGARDWMRRKLVALIQNYPESAPAWFATGMSALLIDEIPGKVDRSKGLAGGVETAAFLRWVEKEYGGQVLLVVSQDCQGGRYDEGLWNFLTRKSLGELLADYEAQ